MESGGSVNKESIVDDILGLKVLELDQTLKRVKNRLDWVEAKNIRVSLKNQVLVLSAGDKEVTLRHLTKMERTNLEMTFPGIKD